MAASDHAKAGWRAYHMGWVYYLRGQADAVLACADRVAVHWQMPQSGSGEPVLAIQLRGLGHKLKKDYPAAIAAHRESLELGRKLSTKSSKYLAASLNSLADVKRLSGKLDEAEKDYREALDVAREVNYTEGLASYTGNLALLGTRSEKRARG